MIKINIKNETPNKSIITLSQLPKGFGYTFGNIFQKLLINIPGSNPTFIILQQNQKIILPTQDKISGIQESLEEVVAKIKETIRLDKTSNKEIIISVSKGEKQCISSDQVGLYSEQNILFHTTGTDDITLTIFFTDSGNTDKNSIFLLNSTSSPVLQTNFSITSDIVNGSWNYDALAITIKTDHSMAPEDAFKHACSKIAQDVMNLTNQVN